VKRAASGSVFSGHSPTVQLLDTPAASEHSRGRPANLVSCRPGIAVRDAVFSSRAVPMVVVPVADRSCGSRDQPRRLYEVATDSQCQADREREWFLIFVRDRRRICRPW
jgi:hypothetical protein